MKILYVSQYFPPEMGAPAARASELARHWAEAGHEISVLTGFPNHPTGVVPDEWRGRLRRLTYDERIYQNSAGSVDVFRTWLWTLPHRKAHERMRNYASFCVSAALRGLAIPRPDVIIASSPQLLVGLSGAVDRLRPASALGLRSARSLAGIIDRRWGRRCRLPVASCAGGRGEVSLPKFLYQRSDHIVVVTPAFKEHLMRHWRVPAEKIQVVENGVETDLFAPPQPPPTTRCDGNSPPKESSWSASGTRCARLHQQTPEVISENLNGSLAQQRGLRPRSHSHSCLVFHRFLRLPN